MCEVNFPAMHLQRAQTVALIHAFRVPIVHARAPVPPRSPRKHATALLALLLCMSFLPYALPRADRPAWYTDGLSVEQLRERRAIEKLTTIANNF